MGMVGNPEEAQFIYDWSVRFNDDFEYWFDGDIEENTPEGWTFLGSGMFRAAFRAPSGACYKVQKSPTSAWGQTNYHEFQNYLTLLKAKMPEHTRLPSYTLYQVGETPPSPYGYRTPIGVSAMECIEGETLYDSDEPYEDMELMRKIQRACRLSDIHSGNVMKEYRTGDLVLVDLGE